MNGRSRSTLPGFGLSLGYTVFYLSLIVLVPLGAAFARAASIGPPDFWRLVSTPRAVASYEVTFGCSLLAASVNVLFGTLIAWVLVRYRFPLKRAIDAFVDLPFALPTAVAGVALVTIYAKNGWVGAPLAHLGVEVAFTRLGIVIALTFIGLPFVVRTVQPVLQELDKELEEAAASLGAGRIQTFTRVILPTILPAILTGFALALARGIGEYGSVIFIAGNVPMHTEITPLLIVTQLEEYDYAGATAIAVSLLLVSFAMLLAINRVQHWSSARFGGAA